MVNELVVLLAVKNLKQRGSRIALVIACKLVYLIKDKQRIVCSGILNSCDYSAGDRADIGSAVTADFSLVLNAAERNTLTLSANRLSY